VVLEKMGMGMGIAGIQEFLDEMGGGRRELGLVGSVGW
jgi:hypothetical protein